MHTVEAASELLAVILVAAAGGKLGPAYGISRACGVGPRESAVIAVLVNTRGLSELIALNVGLANGIIGKRLFTILVLMALITTMGAGPLLSLICRSRAPLPAGPGRRLPSADALRRSP